MNASQLPPISSDDMYAVPGYGVGTRTPLPLDSSIPIGEWVMTVFRNERGWGARRIDRTWHVSSRHG